MNHGQMIGSMIVYEFPDRKALDEKLKEEPYITEGVWVKIDIIPFRKQSFDRIKQFF